MANTILTVVTVGRYTLVEIQTPEGVKAVGVARRSQGDKEHPTKGVEIATGRANKAAGIKSKRGKLHHAFMG